MDNSLKNKLMDICNQAYKDFKNIKNVVGVGIGFKYVDGKNTEELCIQVLVSKKIDEKSLATNDIIPKEYLGIKTDIIEVGSIAPYI